MAPIIVVMGASGHQGGAVARHLLSEGWRIRAITRQAASKESELIRKMGAQLFPVERDEGEALESALEGAYGLFTVQQPWEQGVDGEIQRGRAIVEAARRAGIKQCVYSSAFAAPTNERYAAERAARLEVEEALLSSGIKSTLLHPAFFMENFCLSSIRDSIYQGVLGLPLDIDEPLQMISADDMGSVVARVFAFPDKYAGEDWDLAADEMTGPELAVVFTRVLGRLVEFTPMKVEDLRRMSREFALLYEWFNSGVSQADLGFLRKEFPELKKFEDWLVETGWAEAVEYEPAQYR